MNPGEGRIDACDPRAGRGYAVRLGGDEGLRLSNHLSFGTGRPPAVTMMLRNIGIEDRTIHSDRLHPTLLTGQPRGKRRLWSASDGPSVAVITNHAFAGGPDREPRWGASGALNGVAYAWTIGEANALPAKFVLKPAEQRVIRIDLRLAEGEYEFLSGYAGGGRYVVGNRVGFDVDAAGNVRRPQPRIPERPRKLADLRLPLPELLPSLR